MGSRGEKKTNQMLGEQTQRYNQFADTMGQRGAEDRAYSTGSRGKIDDAYWNLYNDAGSSGGGGGGPAYQKAVYKDAIENEAMPMFRDWSKTGGVSDRQFSDIIGQGTSSVPGMFEAVQRSLDANPNVGYGSQSAKLLRDQGRAGAEATLNARLGAENLRRQGQQWGGEHLYTGSESDIGRKMQIERERIGEDKAAQAAASAAANRRAGAAGDAFRNRMAILGELRGLRGEGGSDLAYADRQLAGMGGATNSINSRVQEQSLLDKIGQGAGIVGNLAGSAAGAFTGLGGAGSALGKMNKLGTQQANRFLANPSLLAP